MRVEVHLAGTKSSVLDIMYIHLVDGDGDGGLGFLAANDASAKWWHAFWLVRRAKKLVLSFQ